MERKEKGKKRIEINQDEREQTRKNHNLGTNMSHYSSSVNGEGTSHKDPLSRILDELRTSWLYIVNRKKRGHV